MFKLVGIATHAESHGPMTEWNDGTIGPTGLVNDRPHKPASKRHVTILSEMSWDDACEDAGHRGLHWTTRRANLLICGKIFGPQDVGKKVRIGTVVLEITGECTPCPRMDQQAIGLTAALEPNWRAGVTCRVIEPGDIGFWMEVFIE